jgi:ADP-heptose:LPS heptosyltransferase
VGENELKRIGDEFERSLVAELIHARAIVILDRGAGENELRRADAVIDNALKLKPDVRVIEIDEENLKQTIESNRLTGADPVIWRGRVGMLAALIGESDLYAGYDSAGQHIAAAMGIPCIDVMAGYTSPRMIERWRPTGKNKSRVIAIDTLSAPADQKAVLDEAMRCAREFLKA